MYFLQQVQKQEIKETCIKAGNQVEYFISSETVSQSWLALYVMLFNQNFFNFWYFCRCSEILLIISEKKMFYLVFINFNDKELTSFLVNWFLISRSRLFLLNKA